MTSAIPGAAAPPHRNLSSSFTKHCYGGYVGGGCTSIGSFSDGSYGLMSRLEEGYGCSSEAEESTPPPPPSGPAPCLLTLGSSSDPVLVSRQIFMAEQQPDESIRTDQSTVNQAAGSSNSLKDAPRDQDDRGDDDHDQGWLRLSIGGLTAATPRNDSDDHDDTDNKQQQQQQQGEEDEDDGRPQPQVLSLGHLRSSPGGRGGMVELDLLPPAGSSMSTASTSPQQLRSYIAPFNSMFHIGGPAEFRAPPPPPPPRPPLTANYLINTPSPLFLQHPGRGGTISLTSSSSPPHQEITNWPANSRVVSSTTLHTCSSSSPSLVVQPPGPYFPRPFHLHAGIGAATARPAGIDFRVVDPPRRPHSGIWFMLQAQQNQAKEPFLPQISKSFLRIKDGGMTIRLVIKYLVNKLKLESESEVEIRCRGQQVLPFLTLQHVRDSIWSPSDVVTLLPDSSPTDHLMVLHYGRSA